MVMKNLLKYLFIVLIILSFTGCTQQEEPIQRIKKNLKGVPEYSIILEDMKDDGIFSTSYFHKYRVIVESNGWLTDWMQVSEQYYKDNEKFLGMSLATKTDGKESNTASPPGYNYVDNPKYGEWKKDSNGNSFWVFFGQYMMLRTLFGGWYRPIYMNDYRSYSNYRSQKRPFFGSKNQYGSNGSVAKKAKPGFFERKKARSSLGRSSFRDRVSQRVGRSRTGFRSRSRFGGGK